MIRLRYLSFLVLVGIQGIFSAQGIGAEPSRSPAATSSQEKPVRVAVVIGNSRYPSGALANPKNDATAIAASLKNLGFDVELKLDASKTDLDAVFKRFSDKAEKASVAAVFYAGHGIQVNGSNYIVPIDANPQNERDLKRELVKMDDVIDDMSTAKVKLVFFDACRDNPLSRSFSRGGSRGMAAPVEATGTLISFATKHGNTALDGEGKHSPYTTALLTELESPGGVEIEQMLRKVQQGVKQLTKGQQEPWRYGSLDGDFYFKAGSAPADTAKAQREAVDRAVSDAMRDANDRAAREKAELQQSIKTQQAATESAAAEAIKRSNDQAARERTDAAREKAELQQSIKAQQTATESAVTAAIKRANEQSALERAELQQTMEKMLREALVRQNAAIEALRLARGEPVKAQTPPQLSSTAAVAKTQPPIQLASIAPTNTSSASGPSQSTLTSLSASAGDEWEYMAIDERFGKKQKLTLRVKAASPEGVFEEIIWNGNTVQEWVFGESAAALATPNESEFMFAPHWNGSEFSDLLIEGGTSKCTGVGNSCRLTLKIAGTEKLTIAAGVFDAIRLEGWIRIKMGPFAASGQVTIWYSKDQKRLLKQTSDANGMGGFKFKETLELSAIRLAPR
jgi:uncharacterized caspase-like protein